MRWNHPKGLMMLFFVEMWERFSYYGMRAILVFFMYSTIEKGGLGWTKASALELYGWYTMFVYVMSILGGWVADRFLGQKKTVFVGGVILCIGHGILAVHDIWAFYAGLVLIVFGVGLLKPNISTLVGALYKDGDDRRDQGFTIFYIGINIGAAVASIVVGYVGEVIGWHYGFGLAGIGMAIGQIVFIRGQKYLVGIGDFTGGKNSDSSAKVKQPLTKIEKDRIKVLLLSFLIIIVFWGAFEQAGGLLNIYAKEKINLVLPIINWSIPASWFQSANPIFIIVFGTIVANFWIRRRKREKEVSALFKMSVGTIIMGVGFLFMAGASITLEGEPYGKANMMWLLIAYLLCTIGELCASPVALSFITKLAPLKYASLMMGLYFAATGLGSKLAASIGESAQEAPVGIALTADKDEFIAFAPDSAIYKDEGFIWKADLKVQGDTLALIENQGQGVDLMNFISIDEEAKSRLLEEMNTLDEDLHVILRLEKDVEAKKITTNTGDGQNYSGILQVVEFQNQKEKRVFFFITILTTVFGLLIIVFLRKLKALTHGAE